MTDLAVEATSLVKRFGDVEAVSAIDLAVKPGEVFGFLGPNGAGKSTTINMLCTLTHPTSGSARVAGHDVVHDRDAVRRSIGLVFQDTTLDAYLSAEQNLRFHAELYGVPRDQTEQRIDALLRMVDLSERRRAKVMTFSGGMKRRLEIARGLMHLPQVLFLDEPTIGLDPQTRSSIWAYVKQLRQEHAITVFMTTHYMDEAEFCDRIAIIDHGRIVAVDTPDALKASVGHDRVQLRTADDPAAIDALKTTFDITASMADGQVTFGVAQGEQFVPRLFAQLGVPITAVSVARPSLDDVFMSYTGKTIRDAEATSGNLEMMRMFRAGRGRG